MQLADIDPDIYFSPDYATARRRFLAAAERCGARIESLVLHPELRGPGGEELAIDLAWLGAARPSRVLLHSSGVHGVEGFAGSAIQVRALESQAQSIAPPKNCAVVFAHALNPYGMAWLRRVNEHNVDLNRNFMATREDWRGCSEGYRILHPLFNPASPPRFDFFSLRLFCKLMRHGWKKLQQAGAEGQYAFPLGLFYGGGGLERGPELYLDWITRNLGRAERVVGIDVHTGLGKKGDQLVILERNQGGAFHQFLAPRYGSRLDNVNPEDAVVYHVRGGVDQGVPRVFEKAREVDFVTQEFGTVNGFRILSALREENRLTHYGPPLQPALLQHPAKRRIRAAFTPGDAAWKRAILRQGETLLRECAEFLFR